MNQPHTVHHLAYAVHADRRRAQRTQRLDGSLRHTVSPALGRLLLAQVVERYESVRRSGRATCADGERRRAQAPANAVAGVSGSDSNKKLKQGAGTDNLSPLPAFLSILVGCTRRSHRSVFGVFRDFVQNLVNRRHQRARRAPALGRGDNFWRQVICGSVRMKHNYIF